MIQRANTDPIVVAAGGRELDALLRSASRLGEHLSRRVRLVSVLHAGGASSPREPDNGQERARSLGPMLDDTLTRIFGARPDWDADVVVGDPARVVGASARTAGASLIVAGIGRHHPIDRLLGAETTLAIVRVAPCPVLALSREMHDVPRQVVVATDFSATCAEAVRAVLPLLGAAASLVFVHVWQPSAMESALERDESYRSQLPARFCRFIASLELPSSITVRQEILEGHIAERVLDLAEAIEADLVVLGRHGRGAVERLLVGSVATRVLRGTTRSVLVVPEVAVAASNGARSAGEVTVETADHATWASLFADFSQRNAGRSSVLAVTDTAMRASAEERGYRFVETVYDADHTTVEIVLGEPLGPRHVRRIVDGITSVTLVSTTEGGDKTLHLAQVNGETVLGFLSVGALATLDA